MPTPGWRVGWRTSTRSSNGTDCVEVNLAAHGVAMRDSKAKGTGPVIHFTVEEWTTFIRETVDGLPNDNGAVTVNTQAGATCVRAVTSGVTLRFTPGEWTAFLAGARDGEFDYPHEPVLPAG
jgi:hypothetical protein